MRKPGYCVIHTMQSARSVTGTRGVEGTVCTAPYRLARAGVPGFTEFLPVTGRKPGLEEVV